MLGSTVNISWKACVMIGMGLLDLGLSGFSIVESGSGDLSRFIREHLTIFGFAIPFGSLSLMTGLLGWATRLDRKGRVRIAKFALLLPPFILIAAGYSDNHGVHGVFPLFLISIAPVILVGAIVATLAAKANT